MADSRRVGLAVVLALATGVVVSPGVGRCASYTNVGSASVTVSPHGETGNENVWVSCFWWKDTSDDPVQDIYYRVDGGEEWSALFGYGPTEYSCPDGGSGCDAGIVRTTVLGGATGFTVGTTLDFALFMIDGTQGGTVEYTEGGYADSSPYSWWADIRWKETWYLELHSVDQPVAAPVPVPAAGVLFASGLVGLAGWRRRAGDRRV